MTDLPLGAATGDAGAPGGPAGGVSAPRRRGCLLWFVLAVAVVLVAVAGGVAYVGYSIYSLTSAGPVPVPVVAPAPGQAEKVEDRIEAFREREAPGAAESLEISAEDLNALVGGTPEGRRYAGKAFFRIEGDRLLADVSLPLSDLERVGVRFLSGRYFNGTVSLAILPKPVDEPGEKPRKAGAKDVPAPRPKLYVDSVTAGGRTLPEWYLGQLRDVDLVEKLVPDLIPMAEKLGVAEIRDGKIRLRR